MQKRNLFLILILGLFLISFTSAYYGSYNSFSLSSLLDSIDSSTMLLGITFIVSFAFINFSLSKVFKDQEGNPNKATAGIVAFAISLLITYGINKTGFDIEGLFYNIGFSEGFLATIIPLILLGGAIYLGIKFSFGMVLIVSGSLFCIVSFTSLIYEKGITLVLGIILLVIGGWLWKRKRHPKEKQSRNYSYSYPK